MRFKHLPEVVLVEDTLDDELMSLKGISHSGIQSNVTVKRDGAEAIKHLCSEDSAVPAVILLDYRLPKVNGLEILIALRKHEKTRLVPVVMMSGTYTQELLSNLYSVGANSCVAKADHPKTYVDRVAQLNRYWINVNL